MSADLQRLIIQPRGASNPQIAKVDMTLRSMGPNGILYKLVDKEDYNKFRVLTDDEVNMELERSQTMAYGYKMKTGAKQKAVTYVPPKLMKTSSDVQANRNIIQHKPNHSKSQKKIRSAPAATISSGGSRIMQNSRQARPESASREESDDNCEYAIPPYDHAEPPLYDELSSPMLSANQAAAVFLSTNPERTRPSSVGSRARPTTSTANLEVSLNLQADVDKYLQKRRAIEERERRLKFEQENFELSQKNRYLRASLHGQPFTDMLKRSEQSHREFQSKLDAKYARQKEKLAQERKEAVALRLEHANKPVQLGGHTWRELEELENVKRKERIEKRRQELQLLAASCPQIDKLATRARSNSVSKLHTTTAALTASQSNIFGKGTGGGVDDGAGTQVKLTAQDFVANMNARHLALQKKKDEKQALLQQREKELEIQKLKEEKRRMDKIFNAKIPDSGRRLTTAAENRAIMVRKSFEQAALDQKKEEDKCNKKSKALREMSCVMKSVIADREAERKAAHSGYVELNNTAERSKQAAALARQEYRSKLRENKQKLKRVQETRPTLIERHEQMMAAKLSKAAALEKVARAVLSTARTASEQAAKSHDAGKRGNDSGYDADDIFNDHEKLSLGMRDSERR